MPKKAASKENNDPESLPDHLGLGYIQMLDRFHRALRPKSYLEVGTRSGQSLALADCSTIAIDPDFKISDADIIAKIVRSKSASFFSMSSDDFFAAYDPTLILGCKIDMAFLDGLHRCEFLLRDFINVAKHGKPNSIIFMHDCLPLEIPMTSRAEESRPPPARSHRKDWWTGDVWRTALLLKRRCPDLKMLAFNAAPTGLVAITNLNPRRDDISQNYYRHVSEMLTWNLEDITIKALFDELGMVSTSSCLSDTQISAEFWL